MSPMWRQQSREDGMTEHILEGVSVGAVVTVDPALRRTAISVVFVVLGTDEATVARCKQRAEQLLIDSNRKDPS